MIDQGRVIGEYAIRTWRNEHSPDSGLGFDSLLMLDQIGEALTWMERP